VTTSKNGVFSVGEAMDTVYILWHVHSVDGTEDEKLIGVYRSEEDAGAVVLKLKDKAGFRETQDVFLSIDARSIAHFGKKGS
jgi:hypothetical protein